MNNTGMFSLKDQGNVAISKIEQMPEDGRNI
jgi:hypothetical protein